MTDCPLPIRHYDRVVLGHGAGGRLSADLVENVFIPGFGLDPAVPLEDQATLALDAASIAVTTDSFVVHPIFFPGGDIGRLAIDGTVNDLAVGGANPRWITAAFVIEEGFPIADLQRVVASMRSACLEAEVRLVAGDTKVVERGKGDGVFITTTGIGVVPRGRALSIANAQAGDCILVSGPLGDHGVAILSAREGIDLETALVSDVAPVTGLVRSLLAAVPSVRCMRDPTRGGLASAVNELAQASRVGIRIDERALPFRDAVRAACEQWGLDALHMACEGRVMAVVPAADAQRALAAMRGHPLGRDAAIVGECVVTRPGVVTLVSRAGGERTLAMPAGEPLPHILQAVAYDTTDARNAQQLMLERAVKQAKHDEELAIARRVQTQILPRDLTLHGYAIAACMHPATDIGGDYYDLLRTPEATWLAIGDVSGHGLDAGLVMMMAQSAMAAIVQARPSGAPRQIIGVLNEVLFENIRKRLGSRDHVTLTLLRIEPSGRLVFAGAHEDIIVWRACDRRIECIRTPGAWLGGRRGIDNVTIDTTLQLAEGDLMVLYTDGITEARNAAGTMLALDGLASIIEQVADRSPEEIRDHVIARVRSFMASQHDDMTLVVVRRAATP